jgi:hypothetical protein
VPFRGFQRYSFSENSVRQNAPKSPGVYGIANASEWILVGAGEDLQAALLVHLRAFGTVLHSRAPTGFVFESGDARSSLARQEHLIAELDPICNRE